MKLRWNCPNPYFQLYWCVPDTENTCFLSIIFPSLLTVYLSSPFSFSSLTTYVIFLPVFPQVSNILTVKYDVCWKLEWQLSLQLSDLAHQSTQNHRIIGLVGKTQGAPLCGKNPVDIKMICFALLLANDKRDLRHNGKRLKHGKAILKLCCVVNSILFFLIRKNQYSCWI